MKINNLFFLAILSFLGLAAYAQTDTIYRTNGERLFVDITEIGENSIKYVYPKETLINSIDKAGIAKVHFKSGRKEEYASTFNIAAVKGCKDWQMVQMSKIESEVKGMFKINNVGAKAKGMTTMSSISKLQDRAYNKAKMEAAMLGGNVIYILEQNTEEALNGGYYGGTKMPSVSISGIVYTSKKVIESEIQEGDYELSNIFVLETNAYEIAENANFMQERILIQKNQFVSENGFLRLVHNFISVDRQIDKYTIIYSADGLIILSGVNTTKNGKTTYYNLFLVRKG